MWLVNVLSRSQVSVCANADPSSLVPRSCWYLVVDMVDEPFLEQQKYQIWWMIARRARCERGGERRAKQTTREKRWWKGGQNQHSWDRSNRIHNRLSSIFMTSNKMNEKSSCRSQTLTHCRLNVGPASTTLAQQSAYNAFCVCEVIHSNWKVVFLSNTKLQSNMNRFYGAREALHDLQFFLRCTICGLWGFLLLGIYLFLKWCKICLRNISNIVVKMMYSIILFHCYL